MFFYILNIYMGILLYRDNIIQALFLFIIIVLGNYVVSTVNCNIQKILTDNYIVKNLVIIILLYFAIDLHNNLDSENPVIHPFTTFIITIVAWIIFIIFSNIDIIIALITFGLLLVTYSIDRYTKYYENLSNINFSNSNLIKIKEIIFILIVFLLFIGLVMYFVKEKGKNKFLNLFKFYQKCRVSPR